MKLSRGFIFTSLAALAWAIQIVVERFILRDVHIASLTVVFWAAIFEIPYWVYIASHNFRDIGKLKPVSVALLVGIALVSGVGVAITEMLALKYSLAVNYAFLIRMVIVFTIIEAYLFLKEPLTLKKCVLAICILVGSYFLTTQGRALSLSQGDIFTLLEAFFISIGNNILGRMASTYMKSDIAASVSTLLSFIPLAAIAWWQHAIVIPSSLFVIMFVAITSILITTFRYRALRLTSASYVTMIFSFTPVFVSFMAIPLLGERLSPIQMVGGALIVLAGVFVEKLKI